MRTCNGFAANCNQLQCASAFRCPSQVLQDDRINRKGAAAGRRCSWSLAQELVAEVDLDKDGTVSYEEFRNMWAPQEAVAA